MDGNKKVNELSDVIQEILQIGQKNGEVSINTIADLVEDKNFSADGLELLYQTLEKNNIKVVNENDDLIYIDDVGDRGENDGCTSENSAAQTGFKDVESDYLDEIKNMHRLSDSEEKILLKNAAEGDDAAVKQLLEGNLYLSAEIAESYGDTGFSFMDLVQEGNLGLLEAIDTYDINGARDFKSYAKEIIRRYMDTALKDFADQMDKPVNTAKALNKLMEVSDRIYKENGRQATLKELSDEMGISEEDVLELFSIADEIMGKSGHDDGCRDCGHSHD